MHALSFYAEIAECITWAPAPILGHRRSSSLLKYFFSHCSRGLCKSMYGYIS